MAEPKECNVNECPCPACTIHRAITRMGTAPKMRPPDLMGDPGLGLLSLLGLTPPRPKVPDSEADAIKELVEGILGPSVTVEVRRKPTDAEVAAATARAEDAAPAAPVAEAPEAVLPVATPTVNVRTPSAFRRRRPRGSTLRDGSMSTIEKRIMGLPLNAEMHFKAALKEIREVVGHNYDAYLVYEPGGWPGEPRGARKYSFLVVPSHTGTDPDGWRGRTDVIVTRDETRTSIAAKVARVKGLLIDNYTTFIANRFAAANPRPDTESTSDAPPAPAPAPAGDTIEPQDPETRPVDSH